MKTIIILLVIIVLNSIINKSIKAKKSASVREERKSTSAQRNEGDIKGVNNDDHRTFDDIDYDELIKVMPEEEIKRRYPSEYARHVNDMLLKQKQEEELKRRKKEKAARQNYKPRKEGERSTFENKPYSKGFQPRDYQNYFYGLQMVYELNVNSNAVCTPTPKNVNIEKRISYLPRNFKINAGAINEADK